MKIYKAVCNRLTYMIDQLVRNIVAKEFSQLLTVSLCEYCQEHHQQARKER